MKTYITRGRQRDLANPWRGMVEELTDIVTTLKAKPGDAAAMARFERLVASMSPADRRELMAALREQLAVAVERGTR